MHPSLEYLLVACIAAGGSYLVTPLARTVAVRWGAVARPRDRDVHAVATPRMGGVALFAGFGLSLLVAHGLPTLHGAFSYDTDIGWVVVGCGLICALGVLDDKYELDSITKLAGQIVATGVVVTKGGVQIVAFYWPWADSGTVVQPGADLAVPLTILLTILTINAVNFIDGLDGLAAGVTAIGGGAFFIYAYHLAQIGDTQPAAAPTLLAAALCGACVGFLPHNFFPAKVFMGDSGSMLVGLVLSAAATTASTGTDPQAIARPSGLLALGLPLFIPVAVLAIPFVDLLLAVVRRVGRGRSPFTPDKKHLHHRMLEIGHTHRRAVLLLYFWSALLAFGVVGLAVLSGAWLLTGALVVLALLGVLASAVPRLRRRRVPRPAVLTDVSRPRQPTRRAS